MGTAPATWGQTGAPRKQVRSLARLEPQGGLITVGVRPGQRIDRILVKQGDTVEAGAALAVLEGHAAAEAQLALAQAQKAAADDQRDRKRKQLVLERQLFDRRMQVRLEAAQNIYNTLEARLQKLLAAQRQLDAQPPQGMTAKERSEFDLTVDNLRADSYRAYQALQEVKIARDAAGAQRALEDQALADTAPEARVLDRQVAQAQAALDVLTVTAPGAGEVLELAAHAGEVSSGPLLFLGDLTTMVARAEVDQSDVGPIQVGDPAEVLILGKVVPGKVSQVGRLVGGNALRNVDPRSPQDLRVVHVAVTLDDSTLAARYVSLQAEVTIKPAR
jgi:HlyD family secretion protein